MRAREFLVEYNRNITAQQVGDRIISAFSKDTSGEIAQLVPDLGELSNSLRTLSRVSPEKIAASISPEKRSDMINLILSAIEAKDPTPNKAYTPWIAKMYAKAGGGLRIEDINRNDLIRLYDVAKKRRMIKPEHADINRFGFYQDFEDTMENDYNNLYDVEKGKEQKEGSASKVFENGDVLVVVPHDEAAACRYGADTHWCTAATRGQNYFDQYNRQGKLYILIPKKPQHDKEKYQLHFPSGQFMDENDEDVYLSFLLTERFPELLEFFYKVEPRIKDTVMLCPDKELQHYINEVSKIADEHVWEIVSELEGNDDYYYSEMLKKYADENDEIDWDKVSENGDDYLNWNDEARRFMTDMESAIRPDVASTREWLLPGYGFEPLASLSELPDIIGSNVQKYDGVMAEFIREKIGMKKEGDRWVAYRVKR